MTSAGAINTNLNTPILAKALILGGIANGWNPLVTAHTVQDGKPLLSNAGHDTSGL